MISTNNYIQGASVSPSLLSPCPHALHLTIVESILQINNDGVSLLRAGNNKSAMVRLARCLALMKSNPIEGDREVRYQFIRSSTAIHINGSLSRTSPRYVFGSPIEVITFDKTDMACSSSCSDNYSEAQTCKLLSIILFNLSLAHHLWALELNETFQHNANEEINQNQEVCSVLSKALRLYELCHSSLIFTSSGMLCADLTIAVVVTNNVGEVHKELDFQRAQHEQRFHPPKNHEYECCKTALACSEQLVQIFMFFTANGEAKRLEDLGDVLSNAMATLNGSQVVAPAA
mmetsp:Transcript_1205/g.3051  ORF Transcript_1205/g.3051 Transcript_1205/m.3051 type:complete len:289 (+) Transcript_1205:128-994(+)